MSRPKRTDSPSKARKAANAVLDATVKGLELSKETIAAAAPVPGLSIALDLLIKTLQKVQATESNSKASQSLVKTVEELAGTLNGLVQKIQGGLNEYPAGSPERNQTRDALTGCDALIKRVDGLRSELDTICGEADKLSQRSFLIRLLLSSRDAEALTDLKEKIDQAHKRFQIEGDVTVEFIVTKSLDGIKMMIAQQQEMLAAQRHSEDEHVLNSIPRVDAALYASAVNAMKARLHKGTRKAILASLQEWADAESQNGEDTRRVRVFVGEAGTGKSTVASEFSKLLEESKLLAATYFFTRGLPDLNSTMKVLPTIAWQLSRFQPALRRPIVDAAREHLKTGALQQLERQFEDLIDKPLRSLPPSHPPIFVVVDGIDECTEEGPDLVPRLLRLLLSAAVRPGSCLRLFLVTRPEPQYIHDVFDDPTFEPHILRMTMQQFRSTVHNDIDRFIRAKLAEHKTSKAWSDSDPYIVDSIVSKSEGLFIYARTAIDFILADLELSLIQERYGALHDAAGSSIGLDHLDALYRTVLENVFPPQFRLPHMQERLKRVLEYLVALQQPVSPAMLEKLTGMPTTESAPILNKLRSVVVFERDNVDSKFRIIHASFREFLVDFKRAGDAFYVRAPEAHRRLADECTLAMQSFRELGERWKDTGPDAMDILQLVADHPPVAHFRYACQFRDLHRAESSSQNLESRQLVKDYPPPIRSFMLYWSNPFGNPGARQAILESVRHAVKQWRGSLSAGSKLEECVSHMDDMCQSIALSLDFHLALIIALSVILDIQALGSQCISDATPGTATTCTAALLDERHVEKLTTNLKRARNQDSSSMLMNLTVAHSDFHEKIIAAGLTPGHPYEDELKEYVERRR